MTRKFLDSTYDLKDPADVKAHYDEWAASYDAEISENGYALPRRAAEALAGLGLSPDVTILDVGCGTGLSGVAFAKAGFSIFDGVDVSADMMAEAKKRGIYRKLSVTEPGEALPDGDYDVIAGVGVLGHGAAPPGLIDLMVEALKPGMILLYSLNDKALADPDYARKVAATKARPDLVLRLEEHGEHLPGIDLKSTIYIFEKT
ncbi:class I SAM-dependent DNA methyltransferase [Nioella sp.]|uniref:class I SAM-dependent DNA methyltransferase n=1 Tax=Nioella sp. TaxID=1912091 RepID=UPI003B525E93